jgi:ABC-type polysaccharide/polyol phosphate export permease
MDVGDEISLSPPTAASGRRRHHSTRVHSPRRAFELRLGAIWAHRKVLPYFGWSVIKRRFAGTWLGWLWIPLRPALNMFSRGFVFGGMLHLGSGDRPYIIFLMVGQASWDFFDRAVYWGFRGIRTQQRALRVMPIPWAAAVASSLFLAALDAIPFVFVGFLASCYYKLTKGSFYIAVSSFRDVANLCFGLVLLVAWGYAMALIVGPLIMVVRDVRYIVRYAIGFWYFLTPVLYAVSALPPKYQGLAVYNPVTAPIEFIKDSLLGTGAPAGASVLVSVVGVVVLLPLGLLFTSYFERRAHARI